MREARWVVYYLFDRTGDLLYIGMTGWFARRLSSHEREQPWGGRIAFCETTACGSQAEAEALERDEILIHVPRYNKEPRARLRRMERQPGAA